MAMTDWSGALAYAFQRHLVTEHEHKKASNAANGRGSAPTESDPRGTTGTTPPIRVVPAIGADEAVVSLGFASCGTTGTTGTTPIGICLQSVDDVDEFEERAAIVKEGAGVPRRWAEAFARLDLMVQRQDVSDPMLRQILDDGGQFLDRWGNEAARLGWSAIDVFGVTGDEQHTHSDAPRGLVPLIGGGVVETIDHDRATVRTPDGGSVVYLRRPRADRLSDWECAGTSRRTR